MNKKMEIYEDAMLEEPNEKDFKNVDEFNKAYAKFSVRLRKTIGWVEPRNQGRVFFEERDGKSDKVCSSVLDKQIVWDVVTDDGGGMTHRTQETAELHSLLLQVNERLKRIENDYQQTICELKETCEILSDKNMMEQLNRRDKGGKTISLDEMKKRLAKKEIENINKKEEKIIKQRLKDIEKGKVVTTKELKKKLKKKK